MFKKDRKLKFTKAHASMNPHLKKLVGKTGVAVCDSYNYEKTLVEFINEPMRPLFCIANSRLELVDAE